MKFRMNGITWYLIEYKKTVWQTFANGETYPIQLGDYELRREGGKYGIACCNYQQLFYHAMEVSKFNIPSIAKYSDVPTWDELVNTYGMVA